jgi:hypothetical protein
VLELCAHREREKALAGHAPLITNIGGQQHGGCDCGDAHRRPGAGIHQGEHKLGPRTGKHIHVHRDNLACVGSRERGESRVKGVVPQRRVSTGAVSQAKEPDADRGSHSGAILIGLHVGLPRRDSCRVSRRACQVRRQLVRDGARQDRQGGHDLQRTASTCTWSCTGHRYMNMGLYASLREEVGGGR